jgi:hypothetical protein
MVIGLGALAHGGAARMMLEDLEGRVQLGCGCSVGACAGAHSHAGFACM